MAGDKAKEAAEKEKKSPMANGPAVSFLYFFILFFFFGLLYF